MAAIAQMARELGRTPKLAEFARSAQISIPRLKQSFATWNQAVRAAGLTPNRLYKRCSEGELLANWGEAVRATGRTPRRYWYLTHGKNNPQTLEIRFGAWQAVPAAFLKFAEGKPEWSDVRVLLEREIRAGVLKVSSHGAAAASFEGAGPRDDAPHARVHRARTVGRPCTGARVRPNAPLAGRPIHGNPMTFRGMRYEPANEQGVVLLFGMMAEELGYVVESAQTAFPDCEAKRRVGPDMWQHVRIEFEFESRNFFHHRHPSQGCDVIVCWRHNWKDCPNEIEVVELAEMLRR